MSHKRNPPRQERRGNGRPPVRRHDAPSVGTEAPGFFNPEMPKSKRQRGALQAAMYNARKQGSQTDG